MNCYNCGVILNRKNRSVEHIINASIGGFRKGYNLLCASCNKAFGRTIDFELGRQLGIFGRLLKIPLDRGEHSLSTELGVIDCDRAIAKICLNYYLSKGYPKEYTGAVRDFVRGENEVPVFYYLPASDIHEGDEVSHIIHLHGGGGVLYAYIELFNMLNRVIIFSMDYAGEDIHVTYCRDVVQSRELVKDVTFQLGKQELEGLGVIEATDVRYERLMKVIERRRALYGS